MPNASVKHGWSRARAFTARLWRCRSAVAYIEFAYTLPPVLAMGLYGVEATNLAMTHMRVSQIALAIADNSSRVGLDNAMALTQFRESDVNDTFMGAKLQAGTMKLTERGRIILSSLNVNADGGQWIQWQRCLGQRKYDSSYGKQGDGATGTSFPGMGPTGKQVKAPEGNAAMFAEVTYQYEPIVSADLFGEPLIRYTATFLVRDERDLNGIFNPNNEAPVASCSTYSS
ncbi:TadE/TadG family type IV pilus assembly protein [Sphingomonas sp. LaA6.9]|uniref:TadE/TadG family type IV pilus assembly protein n=1 Tax=Sphingomonas sp. LaA6.9 TaxID=2919914 RepID=UPI001F4F6B22|nr:hypothetical protein [Sphingomonas sp. LaA6.9]MCJ8156193.1 hypothetical protein [Sphingomonas sp. LaA6.9]